MTDAPLPPSDEEALLEAEGLSTQSLSPGRLAYRRFTRHRLALLSTIGLAFIALFVIFAPFTTRYGEIERLQAFCVAASANQRLTEGGQVTTSSTGTTVPGQTVVTGPALAPPSGGTSATATSAPAVTGPALAPPSGGTTAATSAPVVTPALAPPGGGSSPVVTPGLAPPSGTAAPGGTAGSTSVCEGRLKSSFVSPNGKAWFGTDSLNRDLYSRIIWGGRVSLFIGLAVAISASVIGTVIGAIAGLRGGIIDDLLMRTTDLFLAFPLLVSLLVMRNAFNEQEWLSWLFGELDSIRFIVVLLSLVGWMGAARIIRGVVLSLKEREFIEAARALGSSNTRIVLRHLLPNAVGPIMVAMTTTVVGAITAESTLSFFGYGVNPAEGKSSWGNLLADGKDTVLSGYWWMVVFPAAVFVFTVLCINFIGDGLRDAFDPKQDKGRV